MDSVAGEKDIWNALFSLLPLQPELRWADDDDGWMDGQN